MIFLISIIFLMVSPEMLTLSVSELYKMVPNLSIDGYFNKENLIIALNIFNKWSIFRSILHGVFANVFVSGRI